MNYLAHLFLAQNNSASHVGNLLGDFARGIDKARLPVEVRRGLENHWAVDRFTDQHAEVRLLKSLFSAERRCFAGVALDLVFDHYLIRHWSRFHSASFEETYLSYYQCLLEGRELMPVHMQGVIDRVVKQDWFASYRSLQGIGYALDRIASRIRFQHCFTGVVEELYLHDAQLETAFLHFFPELIEHIEQLAIER